MSPEGKKNKYTLCFEDKTGKPLRSLRKALRFDTSYHFVESNNETFFCALHITCLKKPAEITLLLMKQKPLNYPTGSVLNFCKVLFFFI